MKVAITPTPIQNPVARFFTLAISTGLGLGYAPFASGTFGSLLGIPLGLLLLRMPGWAVYVTCIALFALFAWLAEKACRHWGEMDSGRVVSDEVLGQAIAIAGLRSSLAPDLIPTWAHLIAVFAAFRVIDIVKPFPARTFDRQKTGFGVIADDVVAGIYAALLVLGLTRVWPELFSG